MTRTTKTHRQRATDSRQSTQAGSLVSDTGLALEGRKTPQNPIGVADALFGDVFGMKRVAFVGIDPGQTGGIGIISDVGELISAMPMPQMQVSNTLSTVDCSKVQDLIVYTHSWGWATQAVIEQVSAMPGQGVSSMFKFGAGYGALLACLQLCGVQYRLVTPKKWKRALSLDSDKKKSLARARKLWPNAPLSREKDDGVAEALLLAEYLRVETLWFAANARTRSGPVA